MGFAVVVALQLGELMAQIDEPVVFQAQQHAVEHRADAIGDLIGFLLARIARPDMQREDMFRAGFGAGAPVADLHLVDDDIGERGFLRRGVIDVRAA
jgi:hypothetical protein